MSPHHGGDLERGRWQKVIGTQPENVHFDLDCDKCSMEEYEDEE